MKSRKILIILMLSFTLGIMAGFLRNNTKTEHSPKNQPKQTLPILKAYSTPETKNIFEFEFEDDETILLRINTVALQEIKENLQNQ